MSLAWIQLRTRQECSMVSEPTEIAFDLITKGGQLLSDLLTQQLHRLQVACVVAAMPQPRRARPKQHHYSGLPVGSGTWRKVISNSRWLRSRG
jgi:hypothetical protein